MAHQLRRSCLGLALALLGAASARPVGQPAPALCPVVLEVRDFYHVGRRVTIRLTPGCAAPGVAYVRFRSRGGTQPDGPPGYFTLRGSQQLTRVVPYSWWVEQRDRLGIFRKVIR